MQRIEEFVLANDGMIVKGRILQFKGIAYDGNVPILKAVIDDECEEIEVKVRLHYSLMSRPFVSYELVR